MQRTYCNCCNKEITSENYYSLNGLDVEVHEHTFSIKPPNAMHTNFDICKYCLLDAFYKLDDRPKIYEAEPK